MAPDKLCEKSENYSDVESDHIGDGTVSASQMSMKENEEKRKSDFLRVCVGLYQTHTNSTRVPSSGASVAAWV